MEILISFIIPFIILLTVVVFVHEYGHYYYAKKYGVGVTDFSIGFGKEISIYNLAGIISDIIGYEGNEVWDTKMPEGQFKKPSCNKKFMSLFPDFKYTPLVEGLKTTVNWYLEHYPNVRL